ncbi:MULTISPECIES: hypothetical protein [Roseomonadaceae]|uniref:hypothetical protein n=1 Tax=Roseomonadaceae TaxID=3385906 RepID=UPI001E328A85|nr:hypothetical protein [Roseomonas oleicola]
MSQAIAVSTDKVPSRVSWGAILAGGLVAVAVGAMFNILGVAIGASTIDPLVVGETPEAGSFGVAGAIWLLVANLLGLACGGYVAARLSGTADDTDGVLHGLSVWAIAFLVSAVLLGNVVSGAARGVGGLMQGATEAVTSAAVDAVPEISDPEALVERLQASLQGGGDPANLTEDQRRAEMARLIGERARAGNFPPAARERLAALAAAEFEITAEEANQRITALEAEATRVAQAAETEARQAADAAARAASIGAFWLFATLLLGAAASVLGAKAGTRKTLLLARRYAA